jgi:hypothetical protein
MTDTASYDTTAALGKWFALLNGLRPRYCVSCNAMLVLILTVEHAEEIAATANGGRPVLRPGDDAGDIVVADYGVIEITNELGGAITVRECGETILRIDPESGPVEGRWGAWIVTLAAIARQLEERFARPGRGHLH